MIQRQRTFTGVTFGSRSQRGRVLPLSGNDAVVDADFVGGIPQGWTFARTGNGTVRGLTGLLSTVGTDVPRFDHDQTTGLCRGLYMEGKRTNYLCWSETFSAAPADNNWSDSGDFLRYTWDNTAPDGTATALQASCDVANATCINSLSRTPSANAGCGTFSVWLRRVSGTGSIQITDNNGTNWTTVAVTSSWTRFQLPHRTTAQQCGIRIVTGGDAIQMWGAQLEDGSGASSYIKTGSTAVSRNKDTLSFLGLTGVPPTAMTVLFDYTPVNEQSAGVNGGSGFPTIAGLFSGSNSGYRMLMVHTYAGLTNPRFLTRGYTGATAAIGSFTGATRTVLSNARCAVSFSGSATVTRLASINGATATGQTDGTGPVGSFDRIYVNNYNDQGNDDDYPCYLLRRIRVFPRAMSQAELNAMTA